MQNKIKSIVISLIIIIFALNTQGAIRAENVQEVTPETLAVVLVIDMSDSMNVTDPDKLREIASNVFIDLLSPEDYLGIIVFNTDVVNVLPLQKVISSENKKVFKANLAPYIFARDWTDYKLALDAAYNQLNGLSDANARKMVLFITDGAPSLPRENEPGFMDAYLQTLWGTINTYAVHKIPIYCIGFGSGVKVDILKRIASDTAGDFKILNDQGTLVKSFYETLGVLKNREKIIDTTLTLGNQSGVDFYLDEYTSQATIVIVNKNGNSHEVELINPKGSSANEVANINKTAKYTIVTINNKDSSNYGKWRINLKGTGSVDVFGDKDMTFKSWLISPSNLSVHALNEPIDIEVSVTGKMQEGISVTALVQGPGSLEGEEILLSKGTDNYKGTFTKTQVQGSYSIKINVYLNGESITTMQQTLNVRLIPTLTCDFFSNENGYRIGEKIGVTSSLNLKGIRLTQSGTLKVSNYSILINSNDGLSEIITLQDNGKSENNDIAAEDGLWSGWINFTKESVSNISLIVTGTYNNENFVIEKNLGSFQVLKPGSIDIISSGENLIGSAGKTITMPTTIINNSSFTEILYIDLATDIGAIVNNKLTLEPNSKQTQIIEVRLNDGVSLGSYNMNFTFRAGNKLTEISNSSISKNVEILSPFNFSIRNITDFIKEYKKIVTVSFILPAGIIIVLILIYVFGGLILFDTIYLKKSLVSGILIYHLKGEAVTGEMDYKYNLGRKCKKKIIIHIGENNNMNDYCIKSTTYNFDLVISNNQTRNHSRLITGWIALFKRNANIEYKVSAMAPGIIEKKGEIFTNITIEEGAVFESGGYVFSYLRDKYTKPDKNKNGRDLLEGKG